MLGQPSEQPSSQCGSGPVAFWQGWAGSLVAQTPPASLAWGISVSERDQLPCEGRGPVSSVLDCGQVAGAKDPVSYTWQVEHLGPQEAQLPVSLYFVLGDSTDPSSAVSDLLRPLLSFNSWLL